MVPLEMCAIEPCYREALMDIQKVRAELRSMDRVDLFNLALNQKMSRCIMGGNPCRLYLQYKGSYFCVSEILREGCQLEKLEKLDRDHPHQNPPDFLSQICNKMSAQPSSSKVEGIEFKVYHRDPLTGSAVLLGRIIERRRKERGNNLKHLLGKAMREYSERTKDPSTIFLLR
jgi:hypothetical protein